MKNTTLWILGLLIVLAVGYGIYKYTQSPTAASDYPVGVTNTTGTTDTSGTDTSAGGTGVVGAKPVVVTTGFSAVSTTTAAVLGTVIAEGSPTTYWFEYGTTPALGLSIKNTTETPLTGFQKTTVTMYMKGLKPATQYYFRLGAKNAYGTSYGAPYSFITAAK